MGRLLQVCSWPFLFFLCSRHANRNRCERYQTSLIKNIYMKKWENTIRGPGRPPGSPWGVVANLWYNTAKMSELWAMLHDQEMPETTEHGRSPRPRRRSEQVIVSELRG